MNHRNSNRIQRATAAGFLLLVSWAVAQGQATVPLISLAVERDYAPQNRECDGQSARLSRDGRYIFLATPCRLIPVGPMPEARLFRYDKLGDTFELAYPTGAVQRPPGGSNGELSFSIDTTGQFVSISSADSALVPNDTNGRADIFLRDLGLAITKRVNVRTDGLQANGDSFHPKLSGRGDVIVFLTRATNLTDVSVPTGGGQFVVADIPTGALSALITISPADLGNFSFEYPRSYAVSFGGDLVVIDVPPLTVSPSQLDRAIAYIDLATEQAHELCVDSLGTRLGDACLYAGMSGDGRKIAFATRTGSDYRQYVKDSVSGETTAIGGAFPGFAPPAVVLDTDGSTVMFADSIIDNDRTWCRLVVRNLALGTEREVVIGRSPSAGAMGLGCPVTIDATDDQQVMVTDTWDALIPYVATYYGYTGRRLFVGAGDWVMRDQFE